MFKQMLRRDKRGMSLIELICAVAILTIITGTISGAMVVATNSYRSGTVESALQQEAQFTANSIEALIIDATNTVEYVGNVLKITNVDYTYEIVYDSGAETLRYTQYVTGDPGNRLATNELLAEHVSRFAVDAADFATSRNVRLELTMKNGGKDFTTAYNITSRNNPDAGTPISVTASILCPDSITLEPNESYVMNVSVVGPSNTGYHCYFDPEGDHVMNATATVVGDGIQVNIGNSETGGGDGLLHLWIVTSATDDSGNPWKKDVAVKIRRVTDISLTEFTLLSGTALKADAVYSINGEPTGSNLDKVVAAPYDSNYVDPRTLVWSFEVGNGDPWADYVEVLNPPGDRDLNLRFKLKQDISSGNSLKVIATSRHSLGMDGANQMNKTGLPYDNPVKKFKELKSTNPFHFPDDNIRRGTEQYATVDLDYEQLIRDEWEKNHPGETWDPKYGYNGGYTGNIWFRFISEDGTSTSVGYPSWKLMTNQGDNPAKLKLNAGDFTGMHYMKAYTLEICFSFKYNTRDNQQKYYPEGSNDPNFTPAPEYVYVFPINPMSIAFDTVQDSTGTWSITNLTGNGDGIGTFDNPLRLKKGGDVTFHYNIVTGAVNNRGVFDQVINNRHCYKWNGSGWSPQSTELQKGVTNSNIEVSGGVNGTLKLGTVNNITTGLYKMVLGDIEENGIHEVYANEPVDGQGGRGVIYFELY